MRDCDAARDESVARENAAARNDDYRRGGGLKTPTARDNCILQKPLKRGTSRAVFRDTRNIPSARVRETLNGKVDIYI